MPRLSRWLLARTLPAVYRNQQLGDLEEEFRRRCDHDGHAHARRWYRAQVLRSVGPNLMIRLRQRGHSKRGLRHAMETLIRDFRYGVRTLRRSPGFAAVTIVTLALAIGVNTAIFSLVNLFVFSDLPMEDPGTVGVFESLNDRLGTDEGSVSLPDFLDLREQNTTFESLAAATQGQWIQTGAADPLRLDGYWITANLLDTWRVGVVVGRGLLPGDDRPGAPPVALLSHGYWTREYASSLDVIGTTLRLDGVEHTIVGVISPVMDFASLATNKIYVPLTLDDAEAPRDVRYLFVSGRLRRDVTWDQAKQDVAVINARLREQFPQTNEGWTLRVLTARDSLLQEDDEVIIVLLVLTVAFVLLIACANVANMLLARATARGREIAVRAALGAYRGRLIRQLLIEGLLIALLASALGLLLAKGLMQILILITAGRQLVFTLATIDSNVLLFTLIISVVAPLVFGLLPALRSTGLDVQAGLKDGGVRAGGGRGTNTTRGVLVVVQVALALALMVLAGLSTRAVVTLHAAELGFDPSRLLSMRIDLPDNKYADAESARQFFSRLFDDVRRLPGVEDVAFIDKRPSAEAGPVRVVEIDGRPATNPDERRTAEVLTISPNYLSVMRIPLLRGRTFAETDTEDGVRVALVNAEGVDRYWGPSGDPIGSRVRIGAEDDAPWIEIVGVVSNLWGNELVQAESPKVYLPLGQQARNGMAMLVRSAGEPTAMAGAVRQAVWALDAEQPVDDVRTMDQIRFDETSTNYALLVLFVSFAVFALAMAGAGIYGVASYSVSQRAPEIGIRLAFGAAAADVRRLLLRQGGVLLLIGGALGLGIGYGVSRLVGASVVGLNPSDPITLIGVPAILLAVGLLANYLPALRATRMDPARVLRVE